MAKASPPPKTPAKRAKATPTELAQVDTVKADSTKKIAFLAAFAQTGNIRRAAESSGCSRAAHYKWLDGAEYAKAFAVAQEEAADRLEEEARRRAVEGLRRYKFHQGLPVMDPETGTAYIEHEYSDVLLMFLLKGARPDKFAQRIKAEATTSPDEFDPGRLQLLRDAGLVIVEAELADGTDK